MNPLEAFSPTTRAWFASAFAGPTPAQTLGWPAIATGGDVLIQAPTGSGKTLTAFLYAIDRLNASPGQGLRVLYVSPLKALNYDIERNLRGPLAGLESRLRVGVRTGDTDTKERRALVKEPPDILITTPESLYLMLTSAARESLCGVETLILDEVHAVAGTKRGAHLALSVERLQRLVDRPVQRIGLSATQRPLEEIGRYVSGGRPIQLVDAGTRKELDLQVVVPVDDLRELGSTSALAHPLLSEGEVSDGSAEHAVASIWPSMYPALVAARRRPTARRSSSSTTAASPSGWRCASTKLAERRNCPRAPRFSLAREQRVRHRGRPQGRPDPVPRRDLVPRARHRHGRGRPRHPGRVAEVGRARPAARSGVPGTRLASRLEGPHLPEVPRRSPRMRSRCAGACARARSRRPGYPAQPAWTCSPSRSSRSRADEEIEVDGAARARPPAPIPFAELSRAQLENVLDMLAGRYPSDEFAELRPRIIWDRTGGRHPRPTTVSRQARSHERRDDPRPRPLRCVHRR